MDYAIVKISGKQERIQKDQTLTVDRLTGKPHEKISFGEILLWHVDDKNIIGQPFVPNCVVEAEILEHLKADKIYIKKFKNKVRYRRKRGFRQSVTKIKILNICDKTQKLKEEITKKTKVNKILAKKLKTSRKKLIKKTSK